MKKDICSVFKTIYFMFVILSDFKSFKEQTPSYRKKTFLLTSNTGSSVTYVNNHKPLLSQQLW